MFKKTIDAFAAGCKAAHLFPGRSQDFCCETCSCSMRSALLALTPNSNPSPEDPLAKELAQQINFKVQTLVTESRLMSFNYES